MNLQLRLTSALAPYRIGPIIFGQGPNRRFGVRLLPFAEVPEGTLRDLFADPSIDVSVGFTLPDGRLFTTPVVDLDDMAIIVRRFAEDAAELAGVEGRGTAEILAEHHRLETEQGRDVALPGGDDEDPTAADIRAVPDGGDAGQALTDSAGEQPGAPAEHIAGEAGGVDQLPSAAATAVPGDGAEVETPGDVESTNPAEPPHPPVVAEATKPAKPKRVKTGQE